MQTDADKALAEAKQHILEARDKLREATHPSTMGSDEFKPAVSRGIIQLDLMGSEGLPDMSFDAEMTDYSTDPEEFKADMRRLADTLEEHGV